MCQLKHHLFISKRCVPISNWDNMRSHTIYSTYFLHQFNLSNLLCFETFLLLEESNYIISPSPPQLPSFNFSTTTTHLQFLNIYFIVAKKKIHSNGHTKHLRNNDWYFLISSILDRICEMIKTPLQYPRDPTLLNPLK
jgi:hypothetical protein